jgi:outer membrane lipase/esterase
MQNWISRRAAIVAMAAIVTSAALVGCGSSDRRNVQSVAVFGDSLSDVGSYRWGQVEALGGGRYTTNPGPVWAELVAAHYDLTIQAYQTAGAGNPSPQVIGGLGYAQGGARVTQSPGVGRTPSGAPGIPVESAALPVRDQISAHLSRGRVPRSQLVLVLAGDNDLFYQFGVFVQSVENGVSVPDALQAAGDAMTVAAGELAGEVGRLANAGADKLVVVTPPDPATTPFGQELGAEIRALITELSRTFNQALTAGLASVPNVQQVDLTEFFNAVQAQPAAYGFTNVSVPACNYPTPTAPEAIFCTAQTLNAPDAAQTYLFADGVHPTAAGHAQFARYVLDRITPTIPR